MSDSETSTTSILKPLNQADEDTDNDIEDDDRPAKKSRKESKVYCFNEIFDTYKQALEKVRNNFEGFSWAAKEKQKSKQKGDKEFYKCSECEKRLYIFKPHTNSTASLFVQNIDHVHDDKSWGVPEKTKQLIIKQYFEQNIKPKEIMRWLRDNLHDGYVEVTSSQLNNLVQFQKKKNQTLKPMNIADLKKWVEERSAIPNEDDQLFTVSSFTITPQKVDFKIFFTTRRLILLTQSADHIAADATFKLTWINYPVLLCGTTDKNKSFHPFGLMLSRHQSEEDFEFMFKAIKEQAKNIYDYDFEPTVLLADSAMEITNGFLSTFKRLEKRIVCWAHASRKVKDNCVGVDKKIKAKIREDFNALQITASTLNFKKGWKLLYDKWQVHENQNVKEFLDDFESFWLRDYTYGWFEGYAKGYPSTNNALEASNNVIKKEGTFREQLPMSEFVAFVNKFIVNWSKDRDPNFQSTKKFIKQPEISIRQWTCGFEWLKKNKRIVKLSHNEEDFYMFTSTEVEYEATKSMCRGYLEKNEWFSFDQFIKETNAIRYVRFNSIDWRFSVCSCPDWDKNYICKHVIGIAYNHGLCQFPGLDLNIEANAKRGRRKRAKMALIQRTSTGLINPALQSINIENEIPNESQNVETINQFEQQPETIDQVITQPSTSSITITKISQFEHQPSTSSITITKIVSNIAPKKRGRPPKKNQ